MPCRSSSYRAAGRQPSEQIAHSCGPLALGSTPVARSTGDFHSCERPANRTRSLTAFLRPLCCLLALGGRTTASIEGFSPLTDRIAGRSLCRCEAGFPVAALSGRPPVKSGSVRVCSARRRGHLIRLRCPALQRLAAVRDSHRSAGGWSPRREGRGAITTDSILNLSRSLCNTPTYQQLWK